MPICSYCLCAVGQHTECFGWDEAKASCKITGPDDPKRLERKMQRARGAAKDARKEADDLYGKMLSKVADLRRSAAQYDQEADKIAAQLAKQSAQ